MIYLALIFWAIILAIFSYTYIKRFIPDLIQQVYDNFKEVFPHQAPTLSLKQQRKFSSIKEKSFLSIYSYILFFIIITSYAFYQTTDIRLTIWVSLFVCTTMTIFIIDYLYQFIPISLCMISFFVIILGDYFQVLPFSIEQSVINALIGFVCFYILYYLSKWFYKKEALGRGDYWLVFALSSGLYWQQLSLFIFIASLLAIFYYLICWLFFESKKYIPYAPFLIISTYLLLYCDLFI